ncbi:MAG: hypothetical protein ACYCZO_10415 [Daejeonella sp.]
MKEKDVYAELSSIRDLMERSSKFISLSGMAGILAGLYALAGAGLGYMLVSNLQSGYESQAYQINHPLIFWQLIIIALAVLVFSLGTGCWLTIRKARRRDQNVWNPVSRRLLSAVAIPLFTGGLFILIMLAKGEYSLIAAACLIFYGLSLVAGSHYTFVDVKWLGLCEIVLGLFALIIPGYGLIIWTMGFGLLHIFYGTVMYFKYDR